MIRFAHFVQECPVCGRPLEVRAEYVGSQVTCQHCRGQFRVTEPARTSAATGNTLLRRAGLLLDLAARRTHAY
jgi:hypothetical protein